MLAHAEDALPVAMPNNRHAYRAEFQHKIEEHHCKKQCCYDSIRYWFHPHAVIAGIPYIESQQDRH